MFNKAAGQPAAFFVGNLLAQAGGWKRSRFTNYFLI